MEKVQAALLCAGSAQMLHTSVSHPCLLPLIGVLHVIAFFDLKYKSFAVSRNLQLCVWKCF